MSDTNLDLDRMIDSFRGPLVGLLASWGASPHDAQELAQDTFAEAYLGQQNFRGDVNDLGAQGAWLRGIASNLWRMSRRRANRGPRRIEPLGERDIAQPVEEPESEAAAQLQEALGQLRGPWRTVLQMRYVEECGLAEIAALLGTSERSVEGRLHRARAELKQVLKLGPTASEPSL